MTERHYDVGYVAEFTETTVETVRDWLRTGRLNGIKVGGRWRVPHSELVAFVNEKWGDK